LKVRSSKGENLISTMTERERSKEYNANVKVIEEALEKNRRKWQLKAVSWMDYDDVKQIIKIHIYKKIHLWDSKKGPIEPWISTVISNQIRNLLRNNYQNYARPCLSCINSLGPTSCEITRSGEQDEGCPLFLAWAKKKRDGFNVKMPLPLESHAHEIRTKNDDSFDIDHITARIQIYMKIELTERQFTAFMMMFIDNCSDEDVAEYMGYRSSEKNRKAGYKQLKNLKDLFKKKILEIIEKYDIILSHDY